MSDVVYMSIMKELVKQIKRVADELQQANRLKKLELDGKRPKGLGDIAQEFVKGSGSDSADVGDRKHGFGEVDSSDSADVSDNRHGNGEFGDGDQ